MRFTKLAILLLLLSVFPAMCRASDIAVNPVGPVFVMSGLKWGVSGPGGFNNNFWFSPLNVSESVCVNVYNSNPTNKHIFATSIVVNANPANSTPSDGTWNTAATWTNMVAPVAPGIASNISASVSGSAVVSINLSASSTQSGSPDTAFVVITQTPGTCFSGQNTGASPTVSTNAAEPIQVYSDTLSTGFSGAVLYASAASASELVELNNAATAKTQYLTRMIVSTTSATPVLVNIYNITGGTGSGCASGASFNIKGGSTVTSAATFQGACTGTATGAINAQFLVPALGTITINLAGYILPSNSPYGFMAVLPASVTGTMYATLEWYEK